MEEGEDDVKFAWPLWVGLHMCYNGNYNRNQGFKTKQIQKDGLSLDCSLQFKNMKLAIPIEKQIVVRDVNIIFHYTVCIVDNFVIDWQMSNNANIIQG